MTPAEKQCRFDFDFAVQRLIETGSVSPMFVGFETKRPGLPDPVCVITPWHDTEEKRAMTSAVRILLRVGGYRSVSAMSEAWFLAFDTTPPPGEELPVPSEHPDRVEGLWVLHERVDGTAYFMSAPIRRDEDGKPTGVGERVSDVAIDYRAGTASRLGHTTGGGLKGPMTRMFYPEIDVSPMAFVFAQEFLRNSLKAGPAVVMPPDLAAKFEQ